MTRIYAMVASAVLAALIGGLWLSTLVRGGSGQFEACVSSRVSGSGAIGGPFELVNPQGQTVSDKDVLTKPSLIYFGYTYCPDICPLDTVRNADAVDLLEAAGHEVTPVFITVDPGRDTPEVVGEYAEHVHERMIGLSGSDEQIKRASQSYRTYYKVHDSDDEFYLVDHSTFTYLTLPDHGFVEFFRREISAEDMASKVACFIENA